MLFLSDSEAVLQLSSNYWDSSGQGKDAWTSSSPSGHVFCCTLLTLRCAYVNEWNTLREANEEPCSAVLRWPHTAYGKTLLGVYTDLAMPKTPSVSFGNWSQMDKVCGSNSLSWSNFSFSLTISQFLGNEKY